jgi:glycosyltransferase involved in cell wall biosynthesis
MTLAIPNEVSEQPLDRSKIKILHIVTSLEPGGLENGVVNLANLLDPDRFQTSIVCLERIGEFAQRLGDRTVLNCLEKSAGFRASAVAKLAQMISQTRPDIIHTHNLGPLIYGTLANIASGNTAVVLQGEHAQLRPDEKTVKRRLIRNLCYRGCKMIHTVSDGLRHDLIATGFPEDKIQAILNGVDCTQYSPVEEKARSLLRTQHGLPAESVVIGIVGRFGAFKRHSRLIQGFEQLAQNLPNLHLLMVGDHGPEKERVLEQVAASPYRDRIVWCGYQEQPANFYRMMDLLVVPSDNEGLSNAILEAMACGVTCVAHPACGANEVIIDGNNGILCRMEDADQLASAIRNAISDPQRLGDMSTQARRTAVEKFSIVTMILNYSRLYLNLS